MASLELLWTPHYGDHLLMSGFVHPPTEKRAWEALAAAGETDVLTVKGLEGSTDLPTSRTGITGRFRGDTMERVLLHPRDHGIHGEDIPWSSLETWRAQWIGLAPWWAAAAAKGCGGSCCNRHLDTATSLSW